MLKGSRENARQGNDILRVSSKADKWILGDRKGGSWGSCKDPLWERLLERFGVMREPAARDRERDRSSSCRWARRRPRDRRPYGFRGSFRSWCSDAGIDRELADQSLAHAVGRSSVVPVATLLERRREVMEAWGAFAAS